MLLGVLGALIDVTVAQATAVFEFHALDPTASRGALFGRGMNVGRAHVTAAVHTLALAYVGAGLPLLMLLAVNATVLDAVWNREFVTTEVLRTVAGSIGLAAAMPLTTWLACLTCSPRRVRRRYATFEEYQAAHGVASDTSRPLPLGASEPASSSSRSTVGPDPAVQPDGHQYRGAT
jgi:hypothetical protein